MPFPPTPALVRFWRMVDIDPDGCWRWTGATSGGGYGNFKVIPHRVTAPAHVYSYIVHKGAIPHGLVLDHLCGVRHCVNPNHLEAVTQRENLWRSPNPNFVAARAGTCTQGHPVSGDNAVTERRANGQLRHRCRLCAQERDRRRDRRGKAAA